MNKPIVFLYNQISKNRNGILSSLVSRIKILIDHGHQNIYLVLLEPDLDYPHHFRQLFPENYCTKIKVINIYEDLLGYDSSEYITEPVNPIEITNLIEQSQNNGKIYKTSSNKTIALKNSDKNVITFFDRSSNLIFPSVSTQYHFDGKLYSIRVISKIVNQKPLPATVTYFNHLAQPTIIENYDTNSVLEKIYSIAILKNGVVCGLFEDRLQLYSYWLNEFMLKNNQSILVIDQLNLLPFLSQYRTFKNKVIACLHSAHFGINDENKIFLDRLNPYNEWAFNHPNHFDHLIVLSNRQSHDVKQNYNFAEKVVTIPHVFCTKVSVDFAKKDPNLCVAICTLNNAKQILQMIEMFRQVQKKYPLAKLHIYGEGPLLKDMLKLIQQSQLENNVFYMGFIDCISNALLTPSIYLSTSIIEGYSMAMIEALCHGLAVVAYNANYGVDEIVDHGVNGLLCEVNDQKKWINNLTKLFDNPRFLNEMMLNAYGNIKHKNSQKLYHSWMQLTEVQCL